MKPFDKIIINNTETRSLMGADFAVVSLRCSVPMDPGYEFRFNGEPLEWHPVNRPDLRGGISWFSVYLDLTKLPLKPDNRLSLVKGKPLAEVDLTISPAGIARLSNIREAVDQKRVRLATIQKGGLSKNGKIYNIDPALHDPALRLKTDKVSAHPYAEKFIANLDEIGPEEMVLDVGAGFRFKHHPNIVTLEIFDYPSTDVISFGDAMPFRSKSFDYVYTNAVLEHVDNPFAVATEIGRVLKPGGKLYSSIPFLQVEHGYPFHYFNATRMGHRRLFENDFDIKDVSVGGAGHPWHIIMRSLGLLRSGLPQPARDDFEKLTVGDILSGTYRQWVDSPFGECSEEIMWRLAGSTVLIAEKKR